MQFFRLRSARKRKEAMNRQEAIVAWVGIDWADESHQVCEYEVGTGNKQIYAVEQNAESLQEWINQLRIRHGGGKRIAVVLEQARGGLIYALMSTDFIEIYPVNPQSLAKFRQALYPSGAKSDPVDAELLEEMVRQNPGRFRAWVPGDAQTRSLQLLTEGRRKFVDDMTALTNQLTSALKTYYPQALDWAGELSREQACAFLEKWPTLSDLQKTRAFRIREFYQKYSRPEREALDQRVRQIEKAQPLTQDPAVVMAGVMMVRTLVGQIEPLRAAVEKYDVEIARIFQQHPDRAVFQRFHEFADQARKFCAWSKLYYQQQRAHGKEHHAAVRALAYKWIRIMFRCWKDHKPYDDSRYMKSLVQRGSPLAAGWSQQPVRSVEI